MARQSHIYPRPADERELALDETAASAHDSEPVQPELGTFERMAHIAQNTPILSHLGGLSPTFAIRWLLWLFAVLGSLSGLCIVIVGMLAGLWMLGPISSSTQAVLSDASATTLAAAGGVDAALPLTVVIVNVSNSTADSLLNLSTGLNSMGASLEGLSSIGGIPTGLGVSAASMHAAATNLGPAVVSLQSAGQSANDMGARLTEAGDSLRKASDDLASMRQSIGVSVFYAQVMVVMFSLAMATLLSGVLMLALAYGPPKK